MALEDTDAIVVATVDEPNTEADAGSETVVETGVNEELAEAEAETTESSTGTGEKDGTQKRIDELTKKFRDQERESARLRTELDKVPAPVPELAPFSKTLADFEYDEDAHGKAVEAHYAAESTRVTDEAKQHDSQAVAQNTFNSRQTEFADKNPDYYALTSNQSLPFNGELLATAMESEQGPDVLYHLAKFPETAHRLASMPPRQQAIEMGKIEAKLGLTVTAKTVSDAPSPTPKIKGAENVVSKDPNNMTQAEYAKWRSKRIANR
jgi:hypothetical protein